MAGWVWILIIILIVLLLFGGVGYSRRSDVHRDGTRTVREAPGTGPLGDRAQPRPPEAQGSHAERLERSICGALPRPPFGDRAQRLRLDPVRNLGDDLVDDRFGAGADVVRPHRVHPNVARDVTEPAREAIDLGDRRLTAGEEPEVDDDL